jgi:hypothetical protein
MLGVGSEAYVLGIVAVLIVGALYFAVRAVATTVSVDGRGAELFGGAVGGVVPLLGVGMNLSLVAIAALVGSAVFVGTVLRQQNWLVSTRSDADR